MWSGEVEEEHFRDINVYQKSLTKLDLPTLASWSLSYYISKFV